MKTVEVRPGLTVVVREDWPTHYRLVVMPPERPTACGEARGDWTADPCAVTCAGYLSLLLDRADAVSDLPFSFGLAGLLGGCSATLSGWHVPDAGRRYLLASGGRSALIQVFGVWLEYVEQYDDAPADGRARCLCGWRPTEDAVLALMEMAEVIAVMERPERGVTPTFAQIVAARP